jgi:peptidyl-prolyl cis-trans isomerase SurA
MNLSMNMRIYSVLAAFLLWAGVAGATGEIIPVDGIAAMVNQRPITVGEVIVGVQPMERQLRQRYSGRELARRLDEMYQAILRSAIERALILEEFAQREAEIPRQLVDEQTRTIINEEFGGNREIFLRQLSEEGLSLEDWRQQMRDRLAVMMLRTETIGSRIVVSPRQIRERYEARLDEYQEPASARVAIITLEVANEAALPAQRELAESLRNRVLEGEAFADLAREHSTDTRAAEGGDRGWIDQPQRAFREEIANALAALAPGEVSDVVETPEALYLVQVMDRREQRNVPFEEVRDTLRMEVQREEENRLYQAWISQLEERHHVEIFELADPARNL